MTSDLLLLGCGILADEVQTLIAAKRWPVETSFLEPSLHVNLGKLARCLSCSLDEHADRETIVFYGSCHPLMDDMLAAAHTVRTPGQNCVEMLLGREAFDRELAAGTFFLLEGWARGWDSAMTETFGPHPDVRREIFKASHSSMLAIRTPCSGDFRAAALAASREVDLPLRWLDATLEHLEQCLDTVIRAKIEEAGRGRCRR